MILHFIFWLMLIILIYTYVGYGMILYVIVRIRRWLGFGVKMNRIAGFEPEVCLFVTAYNEKDYAHQKVANSFSLDYPKEKIQYIWVTDGSDDGTPELLKNYPEIEIYHQPERKGKIDAMHRGMHFVRTPYVIFSDTNTRLSRNSIRAMVDCFSDPRVGCVAGEKRIVEHEAENASAAGEGLYWRLESKIKKLDAELHSAVGCVGELFAIRSDLFEPVGSDTLLDDFIISLQIARKGFRIAYTPQAYAEETASLNVREELKRKIRIAAGGLQTMMRLPWLLNVFQYRWLSWQYFSHKLLRWTVAPVFLFLMLPLNVWLVAAENTWMKPSQYSLILWFQLICYVMAAAGWILENKRLRVKILFAPYYFVAINYASILGMLRYMRRQQKVTWEKSRRA